MEDIPIANKSINFMVTRTEASQLHLLCVLDFFSITVPPFDGYIGVCVCIHKHIEGAIAVKLGQKRHRCCYLTVQSLDFGLNLLFRFFWWRRCCVTVHM